MKKNQNYQDALDSIFSFEQLRDYSLETFRKACDNFGNPQKDFKIIHVAGTNGKGSVCKMLFSILKQSGKRVGVFTSPHLIDIRERFETQEGYISKCDFMKHLDIILSGSVELSYFEKCVLIALLHFQEKECEYVILETGVGGRLDTTNIVQPVATCITSIGYDHQKLLGDTLEEIAFEKAGIIKRGIPIFVNFENSIIEEKSKIQDAPYMFIKGERETNMRGKFQRKNAALAYAISTSLGICPEFTDAGLRSVIHHGRFEKIAQNILIDGAHNIDSMKELKEFVSKDSKDFQEIFYCFSLKKGKNAEKIFEIFGKEEKYIFLDIPSDILESPYSFGEKGKIMKKEEVLSDAKNNTNSLYVIFGSLYMIGSFLDF